MLLIDHASQAVDWRGRDKNVAQRTLVSAQTGATNLTIWELHSPVDTGAPMHVHPHEETITVLQGHIVARIGEERVEAHTGQTIYMPVDVPHGFRVVGEHTPSALRGRYLPPLGRPQPIEHTFDVERYVEAVLEAR